VNGQQKRIEHRTEALEAKSKESEHTNKRLEVRVKRLEAQKAHKERKWGASPWE